MSAASDKAAVGTTLEARYSLTVVPQRAHSCARPGRGGSIACTSPQVWQQTMSSRGPIRAVNLQTAFPKGGPHGLPALLLADHSRARGIRAPGARMLADALPGCRPRP